MNSAAMQRCRTALPKNLNAYFSYARGYQAGGYPPRPFAGAATFVAFRPHLCRLV